MALSTQERLKALNKSDQGYLEQMWEGADILSLRQDWHEFDRTVAEERGRSFGNQKRAEWLLKWLLTKLKSDDTLAVNPRLHQASWVFFRWLISICPVHVTAKLLADAQFLHILRRTLNELGQWMTSSVEDHANVALNDRPTKKRKRGSDASDANDQLGRPNQRRIAALETALLALVGLTATSTKITAEHVVVVLTTDVQEAARILRLWQDVLLLDPDNPKDRTLSSVLPIWEASVARGTSDPGVVATAFSTECLLPSLRLLSRTRQSSPDLQLLQTQTEQLLLRHLILPIRSSALTVLSKPKRKKEETRFETKTAEALLQPLWQAVQDGLPDDLLRSPSFIFNAALGLCNRSTPKQRAQEDPWLNSLLVELCSTMTVPIPGDDIDVERDVAIESYRWKPMLRELTDTFSAHQFSPDPLILDSIVRRYSGLCGRNPDEISWPLLASVMKVDASVFLPGAVQSTHRKDTLGPESLHESILRNIASVRRIPEDDDSYNTTYAPQVGNVDDSIGEFEKQNGMLARDFVKDLPIALMRAYAHVRNLPEFLDLWHTELAKYTRYIITGAGLDTLIQHPELAIALRDVFEASLTDRQILRILSRFAEPFAQLEEAQNILYIFTELREDAQGTGAAASLVLLDALIPAIHSDPVIEICKEKLLDLHRSLLSIGSKSAVNKLRMMDRVWRTLTSIQTLVFPRMTTADRRSMVGAVAASGCSIAAVNTIRKATQWEANEVPYERATNAVEFLFTLYANADTNVVDAAVLGDCVSFILTINFWSWIDLIMPLFRHPHLLEAISTEKRSALFDYIFAEAAHPTQSIYDAFGASNVDVAPRTVLLAMVELAITIAAAPVRIDLLRILITAVRSGSLGTANTSKIALEMLTRFPPALIPRSLREECLDTLCHFDRLRRDAAPNGTEKQMQASLGSHLAFMVHLMNAPNATAKICIEPDSLLALCDHDRILDNSHCAALYEELVRRILAHASPQSNFIAKLATLVLEDLTDLAVPALTTLSAARHLVHRVDVDLRDKILLHEAKALLRAASETSDRSDITVNRGLMTLIDSTRQHWQLMKAGNYMSETDLSQLSARCSAQIDLNRIRLIASQDTALKDCATVRKILSVQRPLPDERRLLSDLSHKLKESSLDERVDVLNNLDALEPDEYLSLPTLKVLHVLLSNLSGSNTRATEIELRGDIFARLANEAATTVYAAILGGILDCLKAILAERSWLVSQYGVDSLLSSFTLLTSVSAPTIPTSVAGGLYFQLCTLTTSLVALQRIKIRGRFHLLMPLLVNLLNCLFIPQVRSDTSLSRLPGWLSVDAAPLKSKHATAFARLLSTLASPTVSSVSSYNRRRGDGKSALPLKDETKLARAYTGGYVPVLLSAYCSAQLYGRMTPEVKDALMPGLWACMETVDIEAWRAMSERLRENERAIWQSVWAEWKRAGGGGRGASRDRQPV